MRDSRPSTNGSVFAYSRRFNDRLSIEDPWLRVFVLLCLPDENAECLSHERSSRWPVDDTRWPEFDRVHPSWRFMRSTLISSSMI